MIGVTIGVRYMYVKHKYIFQLQCGAVITRSIFSNIVTKDVRARYGASFRDPASDAYSARVPAIIHALS